MKWSMSSVNAVLDMSGKDSNKIYELRAPDANLIINGDASNVSLSRGYTAGFIIANGASPITIGYTDLYKYSQLPQPIIINSETKDTGLFGNGILDFRDVNITGNEQNNYILHSESVAIMYFKDKNQSNLLKSKLSTNKWADIEYYTGDPNIKTLQHFESIGNDALKHTSNNSVSKVNFIDPDTNTILYSALNSRSLCEKNFRYFHKIGDFRLEGKETIG